MLLMIQIGLNHIKGGSMKKNYEQPKVEVIEIVEDIIIMSNTGEVDFGDLQ